MANEIIQELITELTELNITGAISYSAYKSLISKVRSLQISQ
jgi:hypothetical protein